MNLKERFEAAAAAMSPFRIRREEAAQPSPDELLAFELEAWAGTPECRNHFIPWLESRIERYDAAETSAVESERLSLYWKARRDEALELRREFRKWSRTSRGPTPV